MVVIAPMCLFHTDNSRSYAWHPHTKVVDTAAALNPSLRPVDPLTLSYLARIYLGGNNDDRVSYVADTIPRILGKGQVLQAITFTIQNNGWNTLKLASQEPNETRVMLIGAFANVNFVAWGDADVAPGQDGEMTAHNLTINAFPGLYDFKYGLRRGETSAGAFSLRGNPDYAIKVKVVDQPQTSLFRRTELEIFT